MRGAWIISSLILLAMEDITSRKHAETLLRAHAALLGTQVEDQTAALQQALAHLHREIAARQHLEREAQRAQHFALLGRLAAGMSHEIRNPLGAVFLHVDLLEEELRQPSANSADEVAQALAEIKTQLARLEDLVQDYLSLVRVSALQQAPLDLGHLVTQCVQEMTPALSAQGITLHLDALDQLGTVALHAPTFRRVLVNLVDNARDAMPQGGTLTLRGRRQGATVHLDVGDTGIGIPQSAIARFLSRCIPRNQGAPGWGSISCRRW